METSKSTPRFKFNTSFKIFIYFLSIFFFLFVLYYHALFLSYRQNIDTQKRELLFKDMENLKITLLDNLKQVQEDPYYLYIIGTKAKLRITLFDKNGVVRDSMGILKMGAILDISGTRSESLNSLWNGDPIYYAYTEDQKDVSVYMDLVTPANSQHPLAVRLIKESNPVGNAQSETYLFFLKLFGSVGLCTLGLTFYRFLKESFNKEALFEESHFQDSNPVMNTFEGLIHELKAKEQELEKLKHQAETRAVRSETFQEAILRSISSGVITFSKDKLITSFNESAEKIFGLSRKSALGKSCQEVFGEESQVLEMLNRTIDETEPIVRAEMEVLKGDNKEKIWIGVSSSLLTDSQGEFLGTTFIFTDITEIKVLQEQIDLQKRLSVLGEMSAGIAHEFRNFMGTIFGYVRLLGKKVEKNPPDLKMIEAIVMELKAMDHLIHELLSFGKKTPINKCKVLLEPFFSKLMTQIVSQHKGVIPNIVLELSDPSLSIFSDEILIRQAFLNLIQNALEAMGEGGTLTLKAKLNPVEKNSMVLIQIQDTGIGIPKEHFEKIFVPFFTSKEKGTGLGLAIVHKIILSLGGRIRVESELGKGTLFQIYLPAG